MLLTTNDIPYAPEPEERRLACVLVSGDLFRAPGAWPIHDFLRMPDDMFVMCIERVSKSDVYLIQVSHPALPRLAEGDELRELAPRYFEVQDDEDYYVDVYWPTINRWVRSDEKERDDGV